MPTPKLRLFFCTWKDRMNAVVSNEFDIWNLEYLPLLAIRRRRTYVRKGCFMRTFMRDLEEIQYATEFTLSERFRNDFVAGVDVVDVDLIELVPEPTAKIAMDAWISEAKLHPLQGQIRPLDVLQMPEKNKVLEEQECQEKTTTE